MEHQHKTQNSLPDSSAERVLLFNPAVYDTRYHWAQWQQPTYLLRLATFFLTAEVDVRLMDAVYTTGSAKVKRKRVGSIGLDEETVPKWRFGTPEAEIRKSFIEWKKSGWVPDDVYIEGFSTVWWEGASEAAVIVKDVFPNCRVIMMGGYPAMAPDHARTHGADCVIMEFWPEIALLPANVTLYSAQPTFLYLSTSMGRRPTEEVILEIIGHVGRGIKQFAFIDADIAHQHSVLFRTILEHLVMHRMGAKFTVVGNISPHTLVEQPDLASLMRRAGYTQIFFADDRNAPIGNGEQLIEDYRIASNLCHVAGFPLRTGDICASVSVGRPGEAITERSSTATWATHYAGSVILWPYQPAPQEFPEMSLENVNGKLFPFRQQNNYSYRDYLNLMGLAVVLNSKYRDQTFDFVGDGFVARLLQESIARESWNPDPAVKGTLRVMPLRRN